MSRLLIIGCGGVAQVAIRKCCQNSEVFTEIMIASRTKSKCDDLKAKLEGKTSTKIETTKVDADNVEELKALINAYKPDAVLNVALPCQDLTIMDACLACGFASVQRCTLATSLKKVFTTWSTKLLTTLLMKQWLATVQTLKLPSTKTTLSL